MAASERELTGLRVFLSRSPEATEALGAALALAIEADALLRAEGVAVALDGELGAGKTALTRGVARGLGAQDCVHSPSFTLMHTYEGRLPIYHFDAWMEGRESAFLDGGGAEFGPPVPLDEFPDRKALARYAEDKVRKDVVELLRATPVAANPPVA
jgi:tRNA threonylcarbamoyladenosine biosynthesis protein TsaE